MVAATAVSGRGFRKDNKWMTITTKYFLNIFAHNIK
jgi:hypothetical protein